MILQIKFHNLKYIATVALFYLLRSAEYDNFIYIPVVLVNVSVFVHEKNQMVDFLETLHTY